jgi:hypothetical protein
MMEIINYSCLTMLVTIFAVFMLGIALLFLNISRVNNLWGKDKK